MAREIDVPVDVPVPRSAPGREFVGDPELQGNSAKGIYVAVNSARYVKAGACAVDYHTRSEAHLTGDEGLSGAAFHEYRVRTPRRLGQAGDHIRITLTLLRFTARNFLDPATEWTIQVAINGVLQGVPLEVNGGAQALVATEWVVGDFAIDDTAEYNDVRLQVVAWGSSMGSGDYVRGTAVSPLFTRTEFDEGVLERSIVAIDSDLVGANAPGNTFMLQDAARLMIDAYEIGVPSLLSSSRSGQNRTVNAGPTTLQIGALQLEAPRGVTTVRVWLKCKTDGTPNIADPGGIEVDGTLLAVAGLNQELWYGFDVDVGSAGFKLAVVRGFYVEVLSACAYCADASY